MKLSWQIVRLELKETFSISYGNYTFREALVVSLKSHNTIGYGECTAIDYYSINLNDFTQKLDEIKDQIENQKIIYPTDFYSFLLTFKLPSFLLSALDCAFWDLYGKLEKQSFLDLNSIQINKIPNSSITISIDSFENQKKKIENYNWSHFKVKCKSFDENYFNDLLNINKPIALDTNGSFTIDECLKLQHSNYAQQFTYIEQPMHKGIENYSFLSSKANINWMADEDFQNTNDLKFLQNHYPSINIKLMKCGGLTAALKLIKEAQNLNFKIMIGCMTESSIGISAGAVLAPLCNFADLDGANLISNDIAQGSYINNGKIILTNEYGLGIKLM